MLEETVDRLTDALHQVRRKHDIVPGYLADLRIDIACILPTVTVAKAASGGTHRIIRQGSRKAAQSDFIPAKANDLAGSPCGSQNDFDGGLFPLASNPGEVGIDIPAVIRPGVAVAGEQIGRCLRPLAEKAQQLVAVRP